MSASTLGNFMGGILAAMVRADAQAAISTIEFIERVGFEAGERGPDGQIVRMGRMRMVTFDYHRSDFQGRVEKRTLRLPLLSLVPIPTLHVQDGEFEFSAMVERLDPPDGNPSLLSSAGAILPAPKIVARVAPSAPAPQDAAKPGGDKSQARMDVKVRMRRGDLPGGLVSILGLMGTLPHSGDPEGGPAPSPTPPEGGGGGGGGTSDAGSRSSPADMRLFAVRMARAPGAGPAAEAPPPADATPAEAFAAQPGESYDEFAKRFAEAHAQTPAPAARQAAPAQPAAAATPPSAADIERSVASVADRREALLAALKRLDDGADKEQETETK